MPRWGRPRPSRSARATPDSVGDDAEDGFAVPAVRVEHLSKSYGDNVAVRDVSFEVNEGEVFALLGPNGAGKTTTVEILEGFRHRTGGRVETLGVDPADRTTQRWLRTRIGVVLQELAIEPYYSVRQVLTRNAGYYPDPRPVDEVIELIGLAEKARRPDQAPLGRPAAPPRRGARHHRESGAPLPRRADDRPRPRRAARHVGADQATGVERDDGAAHDALHGRGRGAGRPGGRAVRPRDRGQRHPVVHRRARPRRGDHPLPAARRRRRGGAPDAGGARRRQPRGHPHRGRAARAARPDRLGAGRRTRAGGTVGAAGVSSRTSISG